MVEWYDERRVLLVEMSFMRHMSSILIIIILRSTSGYYYIVIYILGGMLKLAGVFERPLQPLYYSLLLFFYK